MLERRRAVAYALAGISVAAAAGLTAILGQWAEPDFSAVYVLAVLIASWAAGLGPGLFSTILAALAIAFTQSSGRLDLGWDDIMRVSLFIVAAVVVGSLSAQRRAAIAELQRADRAKDDFLAAISHELRTPLVSILGWAQMLRMETPAAEMISTAAASIEQSAKSQQRLIDDLLDISRIVVGKFRMEMRVRDLLPIVSESADQFLPQATLKGIRFICETPSGSCLILADGDRVRQVIWNFLSNALKFTPAGGKITLKVSPDQTHVRVIVSDNGNGIDPALLPHVFERFRQGDDKVGQGGLGLGMAIARHVVEAHDGKVSAESDGPGTGATFTATFPLVAGRPESAASHR